jgi:heme/copper-type cytochrome/quinol oxidase subunit 1
MQYGLPLSVIPLLCVVLWAVIQHKAGSSVPSVLRLSMLLLVLGLVLGALIRADNLMVTAHYHGTNAAVTLAFMGLIYHLLPRLGFADPTEWRMVRWQPYIYATGMGLYILGMAWSGWLDLPRKTSGMAQGLDTMAEQVAMSLMGLGGLVAIIGSAIFVIYCIRALWPQRDTVCVADREQTP